MGQRKAKKEALEAIKARVEPKVQLVKDSMCSCGFLLVAIKTIGLVLFYYSFSITLTFYNQRFIHVFRFPLSITMIHLVTKFILSGIIRAIWNCKTGKERITLGWSIYFKRVAPTGITSSLDIGLSNWSFEFITVSLYTMSKSTVIIFILGFSILLKLEKLRWSLVFVVMFIAVGLFMFTFQSTQFNAIGFTLVMIASFLSGMRWTFAQIVTQKSEIGLGNPLDMMYHVQPWMILAMLPLSAVFEGLHISTTSQAFAFQDYSILMRTCSLLMLGAMLAFMLEFSEYLLLAKTSGLTLSIAGIFKEICTLYLAAKINGDQMSELNMVGMFMCLCGIGLHVVLKSVHGLGREKKAEPQCESMEMLLVDGQANQTETKLSWNKWWMKWPFSCLLLNRPPPSPVKVREVTLGPVSAPEKRQGRIRTVSASDDYPKVHSS